MKNLKNNFLDFDYTKPTNNYISVNMLKNENDKKNIDSKSEYEKKNCFTNYAMINNHQPKWISNSDEEEFSVTNKNQMNDSTTTTQVASSSASSSSCSIPPVPFIPQNLPSFLIQNLSNDQKMDDYKNYVTNSVANKFSSNKSEAILAPLIIEWANLKCEISIKKNFLKRVFSCFIASNPNISFNNENDDNDDLIMKDKKKIKKKLILDKQSGQFKSGTINAIIGASGAGKSTLLECISGRRVNGVEGSVNVYSNTEIFDKNITLAYLGQTEALINVLTVKEALLFASRLKNYKKIKTYKQHVKLVNSIISELKLECCANNYIHSISGGQMKRVAIAAELISGPDIIILDEPTSGLDSCTAYTCIKLLRKLTGLAEHQQHFRAPIVICSIHQPSIQLLNEFHNLYVLSNNGRCIYQGSPKNMISYLSKFNLKCPQLLVDPVNFITEIAAGNYGTALMNFLAEQELSLQEERANKLKDNLFIKENFNGNSTNDLFNQNYKNNKFKMNSDELKVLKKIKISSVVNQMKSQSFPFFYHTSLLIKRTYFGTIREPKLTWLRIFQALFIGFLMSFLYDHPIGELSGCWSKNLALREFFQNNNTLLIQNVFPKNETNLLINQSKFNHQLNSKANTQDNVAFVFFVTLFLVMSSMMPTVLTFPSEVKVLNQERNNGYYACGSYYMAKVIADTPFIVFNAILFCCIVYPLTGQLLELKIFIFFTFVAIVASLIAHCIGMLFGTIYVHSVTSAVFMAPLSMSPVFLFSGFFGKISSLPIFLKPVAYMSYVRYCFECFLISLYGFDRCKITHKNTFSFNNWTLFSSKNNSQLNSTINPSYEALVSENSFENKSTILEPITNDFFKNLLTKNDIWSKFQNDLINKDLNNVKNNIVELNNEDELESSLVLDFYNITDDIFWNNIIILGSIFLFLRIMAYAILVIKTNRLK